MKTRTVEEFEVAIKALDDDVEVKEMKMFDDGTVREAIGFIANNRFVWIASGECVKGRQRVPELDLKFE
ncbi:MAG: hypothetical protein IJ552_11755 [Prevotella sp.]|nr:hypothetical protein [Prevotella sp.]